jgi:hypothetical protein
MCLQDNVQSKASFRIFLICLVLSSLLQIPARHYPDFHPDLMDGLRGLFLGLAIGTMALTAWKNGRRTGLR